MNILETVLKAAGGQAVSAIAKNFGINGSQATDVIGQLIPALSRGMQKNTQSSGGLDGLIGALTGGNHGNYMDNPGDLLQSNNINDGDKILGHLFGDKQVSRDVASRASNNTGVDSSIIKKMLPVIASLAMGAMSKKSAQFGINSPQSSGVTDLLGSFLDSDGDGSIADDLLGMAGKFMR